MMLKRRVVVLAKSAKKNNYCVAGIDIDSGEYVRPISNDKHIEEAVPRKDILYSNGTEVQLLDVVEITFLEETTNNVIQPENFYYDSSYNWHKVGEITLKDLIDWRGFDVRDYVFYNQDRRVTYEAVCMQERSESLLLLPVKDLSVKVARYGDDFPKFRADFRCGGKFYSSFSVGDISIREQYRSCPDGAYRLAREAVALFSLTNPYYRDNCCYKMLAQIFVL